MVNKFESPSPIDALNQVWLKLVVLEKKSKIEKVYRQTDGRMDRRTDGWTDGHTDDGRQAIRKPHLSSQLR